MLFECFANPGYLRLSDFFCCIINIRNFIFIRIICLHIGIFPVYVYCVMNKLLSSV